MIEIRHCSIDDAAEILALYNDAMELQRKKNMVVWPVFEKNFIELEIQEKRQWKLMYDGFLACNWAITFNDREIWGQKDENNSIYIHRIATKPAFRGKRFIDEIVTWAKDYARSKDKQYVRLDTLGNNTRLIEHYTSAGFTFLGITKLEDTRSLPEHYHREPHCCRFELTI